MQLEAECGLWTRGNYLLLSEIRFPGRLVRSVVTILTELCKSIPSGLFPLRHLIKMLYKSALPSDRRIHSTEIFEDEVNLSYLETSHATNFD
jgi:hypothetical protein